MSIELNGFIFYYRFGRQMSLGASAWNPLKTAFAQFSFINRSVEDLAGLKSKDDTAALKKYQESEENKG